MSGRRFSQIAAALLAVFVLWPRAHEERGLPLVEVRAPEAPPESPHPFEQLAPEGGRRVFVSRFVDLGRFATLGDVRLIEGPAEATLLSRQAHTTRAFRIRAPRPEDQDALAWTPPQVGSRARRYVQFAVVVPSGLDPPQQELRLDVSHRGARPLALPSIVIALLVLPWLSAALPRVLDAMGRRWGLSLLLVLLAVTVAGLWQRKWVDSDELDIVGQARKLLVERRATPELYNYPPALVYAHAATSIGYGFYRAASGSVAHHDPYTNQLFLQGAPIRFERALGPNDTAAYFLEESTAVMRRAYAVVGALLVLAVYRLARRVGGERAGFFAGLALLAQPLLLYQSAQILPNGFAALLTVLLVTAALSPLASGAAAFGLGALTGVATAFKYSPIPLLILLGTVAASRRGALRCLAPALLGAALGFVVACPAVVLDPRGLLAGMAVQAFHYGHAGHVHFEADSPWAAIAHGVYLWWPRYWPTFVAAGAAILGALRLLARAQAAGEARAAWTILGTLAVSLLFFSQQFVQFGRNYLSVVALACGLAGLGADALARGLTHFSRAAGRLAAVSIAACLLLLWSELPLGKGLWAHKRSAREDAVAYVDANAPTGARVLLIESPLGLLQGVRPDPVRLRVRRFERAEDVPDALWADADYVITAFETKPPGGRAERFRGPGVSGLSEVYWVHRLGP